MLPISGAVSIEIPLASEICPVKRTFLEQVINIIPGDESVDSIADNIFKVCAQLLLVVINTWQ